MQNKVFTVPVLSVEIVQGIVPLVTRLLWRRGPTLLHKLPPAILVAFRGNLRHRINGVIHGVVWVLIVNPIFF